MSVFEQVFMVFWIVMGMCVLVGIWFFLAVIKKFKYRVRVREIVNGRKIIFDDRARLVEKDGLKYWKLMKLKDLIPIPPADVIDIDTKGRRLVEVYRTEKDEHFWIKDNIEVKEFEPITTEERDFLINNIQRAEKRRGKKWTEQLPMIAGVTALVLIVVCLLIFYKDMAQPLLDMGDKYNQNQEVQLQIVQTLERIDKQIQVLGSEGEFITSSDETNGVTPPR